MTTTKINDVELFVQVTGRGRPLVLVHGSWGDHSSWDAVVPALAARFQVITYDRRGHSASAGGGGPSSTDDDVADLAALIEHVDAGPAHVVGNSFGASIALRLVATRPRLVGSVTVHEPPLFGVLPAANGQPDAEPGATASAVAAVLDLIRFGRHRDAARQFVERIALGPGSWDLLPVRTQAVFEGNAPTWAEEQGDPTWDVIDVAAVDAGDVPVRLTYGTDSPPALRLIARTLAGMLPRAEVVEYPGVGHIPHVTHPDMFSTVLIRHLAVVGPMAGN